MKPRMVLHLGVTSLDEGREFYVETLQLFQETPWMLAEKEANCMLQFIGDQTDEAMAPQPFRLHLSVKIEKGKTRITLPVDDPQAVFDRVKASCFEDKLSGFQAHPFGTWFDVLDPFGNDISIEWYCEGASSGYWAERL